MDKTVEVGSERLAKVETEVTHLSRDVSEIKDELASINEINKGVGESLAKLTLLAEQGERNIKSHLIKHSCPTSGTHGTSSARSGRGIKMTSFSGLLTTLFVQSPLS